MRKLVLALLISISAFSEDKPKNIIGPADMRPEDVQLINQVGNAINSYSANIQDLNREVELAKTKLELNQAKLDRINEVVLPALLSQLRKNYQLLPESDWKFDLKTFTFVKQSLPLDSNNSK